MSGASLSARETVVMPSPVIYAIVLSVGRSRPAVWGVFVLLLSSISCRHRFRETIKSFTAPENGSLLSLADMLGEQSETIQQVCREDSFPGGGSTYPV